MTKLAEIRLLFEAKMKKGIPNPPGSFDPLDLERVKSDKYLHRVLEHCENNVQSATDMLFDIMAWRKTNNINEINEETVNMDYLKYGLFFPHGRDIDSCLLFIMKAKLFVKGQKDINGLKRVIIYWLERMEREEDGKKMTLFFDMDGCGLNNMDIDIITYMITLLKNYYPNFINYIIVFQLPWMLSAAFKIVKGILPAKAIERLRTVNKDKLKELVAPEQALISWGGKDDYTFEFIPEKRASGVGVKSVTFSDGNSNHSPGEMLGLNPPKVLIFKQENDKICAELLVKNMDECVVSFKIRTTAPEKYYVRPSSGILNSGDTLNVEIAVNSGFPINSVDKDRFLVVSIQIPNATMSQSELNELWKSPNTQPDEYRLKCSYVDMEKKDISTYKNQNPDSLECKMNNLQNNHTILLKNIDILKTYQIITMALTFMSALLGFLAYSRSSNVC